MGLALAVVPGAVMSLTDWTSVEGQRLSGVSRLAFGALLVYASPTSRWPRGVKAAGSIVVVAALGILTLPSPGWTNIMSTAIAEHSRLFLTLGSVGNLCTAVLLVAAAKPGRRTWT